VGTSLKDSGALLIADAYGGDSMIRLLRDLVVLTVVAVALVPIAILAAQAERHNALRLG
jgi:hypothetical protein